MNMNIIRALSNSRVLYQNGGVADDTFHLTREDRKEYDVIVRNFLRIVLSFVFFSVSLLYLPSLVSASGFTLRNVGSLNVDGVVYSHLWYTNGSVAFSGGTLPNEVVTATIDGAAATTTANASGNWSYATTLAAGDHSVSFSSIASTVSFTLTIGALPDGVGGLPTATAPTVGSFGPTATVLGFGALLVITPLFLLKKRLQTLS